MLDISNGKIVRVIFLTREFGPDSHQLTDYISGLNDDEKISLVVCMWVGRETYGADEVAEAKETARSFDRMDCPVNTAQTLLVARLLFERDKISIELVEILL